MRDELDEFRSDALRALDGPDVSHDDADIEVGDEGPAIGERRLDAHLEAYFAARDPSSLFGEALLSLADDRSWPEAPAGAAAESARAASRTDALTVGDLLASAGAGTSDVTRRAAAVLWRPIRAIELLLDRPAATLLHEDPSLVAELARSCMVAPERILRAVSASARVTAGSTYGYLPRPAAERTAGADGETPTSVPPIAAWGARFLGATRGDSQ